MPRPNGPRWLFAERYLAERVAQERESRGMTFEGLATRMTAAGCKIQPSALYKIEKGDPPRRITVDELVAFSKVFDLTMTELVTDPARRLPAQAVERYELYLLAIARRADARKRLEQAEADVEEEQRRLGDLLQGHPEIRPDFERMHREKGYGATADDLTAIEALYADEGDEAEKRVRTRRRGTTPPKVRKGTR